MDPNKVPPGGVHAVCSECQRVFLVAVPDDLAPTPVDEIVEEAVALPEEVPVPDEVIEAVGLPEAEVSVAGPDEDALDLAQDLAEPEVEVPSESDEKATPEASAVEAPEPETVETADTEETDEVEAVVAESEAPVEEESKPSFEDLTTLTSEAMADEDLDEQLAGSALSLAADRFGKRDPGERARRLARVLVSDIIAYYPARYRESLARGTVKEDFEDEVKKSWKEYVDQVGLEVAESTPHFEDALNEILAKGEKIF